MARRISAALTLCAAGAAAAGSGSVEASFEDASARIAMTTLAQDAGYILANPEVIRGRVDARFEQQSAARLFSRFAWLLGYELRIRDREVWLEPVAASEANRALG
jgi:hypothetical protein